MRGLATLLRLATNRTEEKRLALADAIQARAVAEAALDTALAGAAAESRGLLPLFAAAEPAPETLRDWAAWRRRAGQDAAALRAALAERRAEEDARREAMRDCIAEGKRLELAIAARARAERLRAARMREAAAEEQALRRDSLPPG